MTKVAFLLGTGLLVGSIACGVGGPDYEEQANKALDGANLDAVDADYDASERVVHVTGTVPSEVDRLRAGDIVEQAVNNGARVANEVTVAGGDEEIADHSISFDANNGVVTISGRVPTTGDKERVETMVRSEEGVRDVTNALEVGAATVGSR